MCVTIRTEDDNHVITHFAISDSFVENRIILLLPFKKPLKITNIISNVLWKFEILRIFVSPLDPCK